MRLATCPMIKHLEELDRRQAAHTSKLLRFTPPVVGYQQRSVILNKRLLQLVLCIFIHVFLVVSHNALCDRLANGVYLRCVPTTIHPDANVDIGEFVEADNEERLIDLVKADKSGTVPLCWSQYVKLKCFDHTRTLNLRISGWTRPRGEPFTFTRPLPACPQKSVFHTFWSHIGQHNIGPCNALQQLQFSSCRSTARSDL